MAQSFNEKMMILQKLNSQVQNLTQLVNSRERNLAIKEQQIKSGQMPNSSPQNLYQNMRRNLSGFGEDGSSPPSGLVPGNVGEINNVIWPYFFRTEAPAISGTVGSIGPNETWQTGFSVTQEAAFIFMSFTKCVYLAEGEDESWGYINPDQQFPAAPGLVFTMRDGSSSRQFFDKPIDLDLYGNPRFPTKFPRPIMLLPNQVMQIAFTNTHASNEYVPFITVFGYRIRVEDAQNFLSLVHG